MNNIAEFTKFYSEKGWQSFPCKPRDKTPLVKWADEATTEINKLNGWVEHFENMNIGIATGARSGIFVLDVDAGHGGFESLEALEAKYGKLPVTPIAITGGGGRHYIFKHPSRAIRNVQNSGKLGKGLDIRGDGGYIIVAPSIHPSGAVYKWHSDFAPSKTPLADAPEWMIDLLTSNEPVKLQNQTRQDNSAIANGGRNNTLTSLAGVMRRRGMGTEAIYTALLQENKDKCIPPLTDREVRMIAESVTRYMPEAQFEQNKDRLQVEWSFCKAIYEFPMNAPDFLTVLPEHFGDHQLTDFWRDITNNIEPIQAATNAGIIQELESYKDYDVSRLDGYARQIIRFAHLAKVQKLGEALKRAAMDANDAGIDKVAQEINRIPMQTGHVIVSIGDTAEEVESRIRERAENPTDVWGIHYAHPRLSILTGGKQKGELILCSAEPKIGKSWWWLQDVLQTGINEVPVFYWCGEMKRTQLMQRFYQLLGVNGRAMKTGKMTDDDWGLLSDAKAVVLNSPIYIDDKPLMLHELRPMLARQKQEHGIEQFVIDYAMKIQAPGRDEIEQTANISKEVKNICLDLDLAGVLITSVNKAGMDNQSVTKANVRGSGQQIHDADIIYVMTKFNGDKGLDYGIMPADYENAIMLHIAAGRELDHQLEGGFIPYQRMHNSPKFKELNRVR